MNNKYKIEYISIDQLRPAEYNPRQMTEKQAKDLEVSIRKFGMIDPIIVNRHFERMNIVIGGHQRLKIAQKLGIDPIPAVYVELDEEQEKELNLRLNKNTGEWDYDLLANFNTDLLINVGWNDEELKEIFQIEIPSEFLEENPKEKEIDENIETKNKCPKCEYEW